MRFLGREPEHLADQRAIDRPSYRPRPQDPTDVGRSGISLRCYREFVLRTSIAGIICQMK